MSENDGVERRKADEVDHVSIERISKTLSERFDRSEKKLDQYLKLLKFLIALLAAFATSVFAVGVWYTNVVRDIELRPTRTVTRQMIDEAKDDIFDALAKNAAADEVRTDALISTLRQQGSSLTQLQEQQVSLRRDITRLESER